MMATLPIYIYALFLRVGNVDTLYSVKHRTQIDNILRTFKSQTKQDLTWMSLTTKSTWLTYCTEILTAMIQVNAGRTRSRTSASHINVDKPHSPPHPVLGSPIYDGFSPPAEEDSYALFTSVVIGRL